MKMVILILLQVLPSLRVDRQTDLGGILFPMPVTLGKNLMTAQSIFGVIVSQVSFFLQIHKIAGNLLDRFRKTLHNPTILTLLPGMVMLDRPVGLSPGTLAPVGSGCAKEGISEIPTESMEHRIISSTYCPFEICLSRLPLRPRPTSRRAAAMRSRGCKFCFFWNHEGKQGIAVGKQVTVYLV